MAPISENACCWGGEPPAHREALGNDQPLKQRLDRANEAFRFEPLFNLGVGQPILDEKVPKPGLLFAGTGGPPFSRHTRSNSLPVALKHDAPGDGDSPFSPKAPYLAALVASSCRSMQKGVAR